MEATHGIPNTILKVLLSCGIVSAVIYIGTDVIAGLLKPGYNFVTTTANLLVAYGSPTRSFVLPLNLSAQLLLLAYAVGTWFMGGDNWGLKVMACLVAGNALLSILSGLAFPWHPDDPMSSNANKTNLALMAASVVVLFLAVVMGIIANQNWMRYLTLGVIVTFLVLAFYSFLRFRIAGGGPLIGVQERTMFYTELVWLSLQAITQMRRI